MVLVGRTITLGTFILPPLLLVVGSSYAIHVMARYYEQAERTERSDRGGRARLRARVGAAARSPRSTTMIGFGSLMVNRIPAIFELGAFAVVGTICLAICTLLPCTASLALLPVERVARRGASATPVLSGCSERSPGPWRVGGGRSSGGRWRLGVLALLGMRRIRGRLRLPLLLHAIDRRCGSDNETINQRDRRLEPVLHRRSRAKPGALRQWVVLKLVKDLQTYLAHAAGDHRRPCRSSTTWSCSSAGSTRAAAATSIVNEQGEVVAAAARPSRSGRHRRTSARC